MCLPLSLSWVGGQVEPSEKRAVIHVPRSAFPLILKNTAVSVLKPMSLQHGWPCSDRDTVCSMGLPAAAQLLSDGQWQAPQEECLDRARAHGAPGPWCPTAPAVSTMVLSCWRPHLKGGRKLVCPHSLLPRSRS